jgi:chromosome partitioning protein
VFSELKRKGMPIFRTVTVERTAYREMFLNGVPPTKAEPTKGAGLEINNLLAEIEDILGATATTSSQAA